MNLSPFPNANDLIVVTAQVMAAAAAQFGDEMLPDEALSKLEPLSQKGRDFVAGTGDFAPDEKEGQ